MMENIRIYSVEEYKEFEAYAEAVNAKEPRKLHCIGSFFYDRNLPVYICINMFNGVETWSVNKRPNPAGYIYPLTMWMHKRQKEEIVTEENIQCEYNTLKNIQ